MSRLRLFLSGLASFSFWLAAIPVSAQCIKLMEPIRGVDCIPALPGLGAFFAYFDLLYPWIVGMAGGVTLLWALIGGIIMLNAGGDATKQGEGKEKLKQAIIGLLIVLFAGMIMNIINPTFYI